VAREMALNALRQQPFPSALTPACERGATALRLHARAKTVLLFSGAFGWLVRAFHKSCLRLRRESGALKLGIQQALSMALSFLLASA
jgi:hypothetical protein